MPNTAPADVRKLEFGTILTLYELDLTSLNNGTTLIYRFCNTEDVTGNVSWGGNDYFPIPMKESGFEYTNSGQDSRPTVTISNIGNIFTELTLNFNNFLGAFFRRIKVFERCLDGRPGANTTEKMADETWTVNRKKSADFSLLVFEVSGPFNTDRIRLGRQILEECSRTYRIFKDGDFDYTGVTCPYRGASSFKKTGEPCSSDLDSCGKKIRDCKLRKVDDFFKGFPNVKRQ